MDIKLLSEMTKDEKKLLIQGLIDQFTKSDERESNIKRKLADEELMEKKINEMIAADEALPKDCPYDSLDEWLISAEKAIITSKKSLVKIEEQKVEIEAFQYYVDNIETA